MAAWAPYGGGRRKRDREKLGLKVHVIRAGEYKGMGEPGTVITRSSSAKPSGMINAMNESYSNLVARGTRLPLSKVRSLADGRVILAGDAVSAGLINGIETLDQTYDELVLRVSLANIDFNDGSKSDGDRPPQTTRRRSKLSTGKSPPQWCAIVSTDGGQSRRSAVKIRRCTSNLSELTVSVGLAPERGDVVRTGVCRTVAQGPHRCNLIISILSY